MSSPTWPRPRSEDAERLVANAKRALRRARAKAQTDRANDERDPAAGRRRGRLARAVNDLTELLEATRQIAAQTRQRLAGVTPDGATRRVSLHDPDARPIAKGRLGKPVEFGHKAQLADNDDGVVLDYTVEQGNPADAPSSHPRSNGSPGAPAGHPERSPPTAATANRRSTTPSTTWVCGTVVIPRKGRPGKARQAEEHRRAFRRTIKWRTGIEGRISTLKRGYGWDRTRIDTTEGARIWTGHGVLAHNLVKISALAA